MRLYFLIFFCPHSFIHSIRFSLLETHCWKLVLYYVIFALSFLLYVEYNGIHS